MPPRTRKTTSPPPDASAEACPICFPAGFPPDTYSLGCEHGTWNAAPPAASGAAAEAGQPEPADTTEPGQ